MPSDVRGNGRERTAYLAAVVVLSVCLLAVSGQAHRQAREHTREVAGLRERVRLAEDVREREQAYVLAKRSERAGRRAPEEARVGASHRRAGAKPASRSGGVPPFPLPR